MGGEMANDHMANRILKDEIAHRIAAGRGDVPADRVIRGARVYDLVTGRLDAADIVIVGDRIVSVSARAEGREIIDASGFIAVPGFIDTHCHVESSLVTPYEFEACILPHGVTTAICDPHEIANVLGAEGIAYFLAAAERMVMDLRVNLSSCVPATHLETAGAALLAADLLPFAAHPKVIGLAEFMNFPGVIHRDPACLDKLAAFAGRHVDGHAPLLAGRDLDAYIAAGILTDHECTSEGEAREKLSKGMNILIREGSVSKDLHALIPLIDIATSPFLAFCTDDRNPLDIAEEGHLDHMIRVAIAAGADPLAVYRVASVSAARAFGLRDRGLIAPGQRADIALIDDLAACRVHQTIVGGAPLSPARLAARAPLAPVGRNSVRIRATVPADFDIPERPGPCPVIGVVPGRIITERLAMNMPRSGGKFRPDPVQDAIKVSVIERHGRNGGMASGFVHGFGLKRGAIASSVGHDAHNLCVVGMDDADMALAANHLATLGGGFCVVQGGVVLADLALPVAGLMSDLPFDQVREKLVILREAARSLGVVLAEPFLQVAFLTLPVIPHLKITDRGMVDVDQFVLLE